MQHMHNHGSGVLHSPGFFLTLWQLVAMDHVVFFAVARFPRRQPVANMLAGE